MPPKYPTEERSFAQNPRAQFWHPTKNKKRPRDCFLKSAQKYWFKCEQCKHDFDAALDHISAKKCSWCPYCSGQCLCSDKSCHMCHEKSFATHLHAAEWHYTKNKTSPRDVFKRSNRKFWFTCNECKHDFETMLNHVYAGSWCPYCCGQRLCSEESCDMCYEKSFASHLHEAEWHPTKNAEKPRDVFKSSDHKYCFKCESCRHDFDARLKDVNNNKWCPYCANPPSRLCSEESCHICYEKSFASNSRAKFWHLTKNNGVNPRDCFISSSKKYWFFCENGHEFDMTLANISAGTWCPFCINKGQTIIYEFIQSLFINAQHEYRFDHICNIKPLPYDILILELKIIIECMGEQH